jgi:hypothetical protein
MRDRNGFVVLASAVGLPFGLVVSSLARSPKIVAAAVLISFSTRVTPRASIAEMRWRVSVVGREIGAL